MLSVIKAETLMLLLICAYFGMFFVGPEIPCTGEQSAHQHSHSHSRLEIEEDENRAHTAQAPARQH